MRLFGCNIGLFAAGTLICTAGGVLAQFGPTANSTVELGYSGGGDISRGTLGLGETDATFTRIRHVQSFPVTRKFSLRAGGEWERIGFGVPTRAEIPNTVHSVQLHLGSSWFIGKKSLLQLETDPGIYSDFADVDLGDFNSPVSARYIHMQSTNFQWVVAAIHNPKSEIPIVGGIGVRWRFLPDWTLDVILPKPQIRYDFSETLSFHAGGEFKGGAYRVAEDFGTRLGQPILNDDDVTYREARVGGGFTWKFNRKVSAQVEAGWLIDRRFSFENARRQLNGDGAPYFQFALRAEY